MWESGGEVNYYVNKPVGTQERVVNSDLKNLFMKKRAGPIFAP